MSDPVTIQQALPLWQWIASVIVVLGGLLSLLGMQMSEIRKRGKQDQQIATLDERCDGLHDSIKSLAARAEKSDLFAIRLDGQIREARRVADAAVPREVCRAQGGHCAAPRNPHDSDERKLPDLGDRGNGGST